MKKKLIDICLVIIKIIIIVGLVILLNRLFMPKYISENQDGRITQEYYREKGNADVVFVGSSIVYSGISPAVLWEEEGITSYNRSNASQTTWISYYMIEDAIKYSKPELVCFDMTFAKYGDDYVEEPSTRKSLDGMRLSSSKIKCINASMGDDEKLMDYLVPLFRFHSRWKELKAEDFKYLLYNKPVTYNGMIKNSEIKPTNRTVLEYEKDSAVLSPRNAEYIRKAIELCQANDVSIMLFKVPSFSSNWSLEYDDQIREIASEYGVEYINYDLYNDEIGLDYTMDTPDEGSHLNTTGAEKFTRYFGHYLVENYDITVRSNDASVASKWDSKIERYYSDK